MSKKSLGTLLRTKSIVQGYYCPTALEDGRVTFYRAKSEAIENLQKQIEDIRELTLREFLTRSKKEIDDAN